jgi:hypothetical protein
MTDHPITPPPELVQQWLGDCMDKLGIESSVYIATRAAQWGADQELEACCEWIAGRDWTWTSAQLRAARRPKPPSLKEQAFLALEALMGPTGGGLHVETIRRALEALDG